MKVFFKKVKRLFVDPKFWIGVGTGIVSGVQGGIIEGVTTFIKIITG
jgi:hypothetical protein